MSFRDNERVRECIECLADLLCPRPTSSIDIDRIVKFLRPASNSTFEHARAIKENIRRSILTHPSSGSDALIIQDTFDKECLKLNYRLLNSFLALLKPLSNHIETHNISINSYKTSTPASSDFSGSANNTISNNVTKLLPKSETSAMYSATVQYNDQQSDKHTPTEMEMQLAEYALLIDSNSMWMSASVEQKVITDLIYVFQGVNGKYFKYDQRSESYVIDPSLRLNSTVRDTTLCLCELGWLYGRVMEYLNRIAGSSSTLTSTAAIENKGLVIQAFSYAIQEELHDYYRLLAVLEQEAKRTAITGIVHHHKDSNSIHSTRGLPVTTRSIDVGHAPLDGVQLVMDDQTGSTTGLTLLRLKAWMQEPIERMCLLARLVDSAGPLTGGALASRLHYYSRHGDGTVNVLLQRIMYAVCVPLYTTLTRWLLHGELNDPHSEFFIGMLQTSAGSGGSGAVGTSGHSLHPLIRNMWKETYFLRPPMLPTFLSSLLAQKILVIGKSINFIKLCIQRLPKQDAIDESRRREGNDKKTKRRSLREINRSKKLTTGARLAEEQDETTSVLTTVDENETDTDSVVDSVPPMSSALAMTTTGQLPTRAQDILSDITTSVVKTALQSLRYGKENLLSEIVSSIAPAIDMRLLRLMKSRFHIETHFSALKKFMLLGQGDFVTCLMDGVGPELKKRATQLFRHNLTGILEGAVRSSNAQYEPSYVTDRIGIRLLESAPGDSGWSIFSLDYSIDSPLNAIVHIDAMAKYRIAFHMLWRLKRVEWSLAIAWKQLTSFTHINSKDINHNLKVVFHKCTLHRARMMHVVTNLSAYLMIEVMESAWVVLQERVRAALCLDDVINAHDAYLTEIMDKALLAPRHEQLNELVQRLLEVILQFCNREENLVTDASTSIDARRVALSLADERSRRGEWGEDATPSHSPSVRQGKYDGVNEKVIERLEASVNDFNGLFDTLMSTLKEQGEATGENLRFLTFRLDFNDYHELKHSADGQRVRMGVSPMTQHTTAGGGTAGGAFPFPHTNSGNEAAAARIRLDRDYTPSK